MDREIKFRLIKSGKIVGYEQHSLITYRDKPDEMGIFHSTHGNLRELEVYNILVHPDKFIEHDKKEEYTSRKDKNGKDSYAGDIVTRMNPNKKCKWLEIIWVACGFYYKCSCGRIFSCPMKLSDELEIIGNIHDKLENKNEHHS